MAEQLTLNQRVQGSSPCAPTTHPCHFMRPIPGAREPAGFRGARAVRGAYQRCRDGPGGVLPANSLGRLRRRISRSILWVDDGALREGWSGGEAEEATLAVPFEGQFADAVEKPNFEQKRGNSTVLLLDRFASIGLVD